VGLEKRTVSQYPPDYHSLYDHHQTNSVFDRVRCHGGPRCPIRCMGFGTGRAWDKPVSTVKRSELIVPSHGDDLMHAMTSGLFADVRARQLADPSVA
jgi:hypothetical protein